MTDADSGPAFWRVLAAETERRGAAAILADVERAMAASPESCVFRTNFAVHERACTAP